jgi:hypothetical protein
MSFHVQRGARWWHHIQQRKEGGKRATVRSVHHDPALSKQHITSSYYGIQLNYEAGVIELLSSKVLLPGFQHPKDCSGSTGFCLYSSTFVDKLNPSKYNSYVTDGYASTSGLCR